MIAIFPEIIQCIQKNNIELLALLIRKYFGGSDASAAQLPVNRVIESFGIDIKYKELDFLAALLVQDKKGTFEITFVIKKHLEPLEENFLIAHLLGYYLFCFQSEVAEGKITKTGYRVTASPLQRYIREQHKKLKKEVHNQENAADHFASCLLLPKRFVLNAYQKKPSFKELAHFFKVSEQLMQARLLKLDCPINNLKPETPEASFKETTSDKKLTKFNLEKIREIAKKIDSTVT